MPHGSFPSSLLTCPILIADDIASDPFDQPIGDETSASEARVDPPDILPPGITIGLFMPGKDGLDCPFMIAEHAPDASAVVVTASEALLLKASGELDQCYGLSDFVDVAKSMDLPMLRAFVALAGVAFKPPGMSAH